MNIARRPLVLKRAGGASAVYFISEFMCVREVSLRIRIFEYIRIYIYKYLLIISLSL